MLFETANKFAIRHNHADQHDDATSTWTGSTGRTCRPSS
jgi:hypothetical protein